MPGGIFYTEDGIGGAVQEVYVEGSEIDVEFVITAHHRGFIELRLCDESRVTQACLNKYEPLHRVRAEYEDDYRLSAQPIDPAAPYKYFLNPVCAFGQDPSVGGYLMKAGFKLPEGVTCERCVIQMWWITANSCVPPGYRTFDFPDEWNTCGGDGGAGWYTSNGADCVGTTRGEEFWNCADVSILPAGPPTAPTTTTTLPPTASPTSAPITTTTTPPTTSSPTPAPSTTASVPSTTTSTPPLSTTVPVTTTTAPLTPSPTTAAPPVPTTTTSSPAPPSTGRPGFCSWNGCIGIANPDYANWCSQSESRCAACGSGTWCNGDEDSAPPPTGCSEVLPLWGKCGGVDRDYSTLCCPDGSTCEYFNQWYSQCKPAKKRLRSKMML
uniref:CBM1 domain-containing protein n=2 Tax=Tetraselmis chuii TaxID=63592 RepID=A0A7S1X728_9CHLO|mmetsp:Transcript_35940/g.64231  ORF Transcript_35940/g.64231 Transcript_35940/m.64231 type:complete len:382 (+) Transcript_35940:743-1888(+)|eukprot:CAMPEP_0177761008 /NCGR_PEP_ID=MMETSP0491_2-20121128/5574_1 /TAXON_ID=63592 /ORGANISM="Tetraselmis chuii, Strain PLY429" /LENGTH=381 /DNA_ID=CAMNT_0019276951 /DNA_START=814 /DNA_END=1959 /DNA_ORIENTATION=+